MGMMWRWTIGVIVVGLVMGLAGRAQGERYTWRNVAIEGGGFVTGVCYHPKNARVVYARTDMGGAYRLDEEGKKWLPLQDGVGAEDYTALHGICSLAVDPTDDKKVYMLTGMYLAEWGQDAAVVRSEDRGRTWKRTNLPFKGDANDQGRWCGERMKVDPNLPSVLMTGTHAAQVFKSVDGAVSWEKMAGFPAVAANVFGVVALEFVGGEAGKPTEKVYAGVSRNGGGATVYKSGDGGKTWAAVEGGPGTASGHYLNRMIKDADGNLLLVYSNSASTNMNEAKPKQGWLWRLKTGDDSWQLLHTTSGYGIGAVAVDPRDARVLMISSLAKWSGTIDLWRSVDGGAKWGAVSVKRSGEPAYMKDGWPYPHWVVDMAISPGDGAELLLCGVPGVYRCRNGKEATQAWEFLGAGFEQTAVVDLASPPTGRVQVYSAVLDLSGFGHEDLDVSPANFLPEMDSSLRIDFAQGDVKKMVRTTAQKPFGAASSDAGATWRKFGEVKGVKRGGNAAIGADGGVMVWSPNGTEVMRSVDEGRNWEAVAGLPGGVEVVADRAKGEVFYAYGRGEGRVYRSGDSGKSFAVVNEEVGKKGSRLVAVPGVSGELWRAGEEGLQRSADGGGRWTKVIRVKKAWAVGFGKGKKEGGVAVYMAGVVGEGSGVFRSDDGAETWEEISDREHRYGSVQAVTGDPRVYGRVYLGTNGRGVVVGDIAK